MLKIFDQNAKITKKSILDSLRNLFTNWPFLQCKNMASFTVTKKQVTQFCTPEIQVKEGINNDNADTLYIKFIRTNTIEKLNLQECLQFNFCVLAQPQSLVFHNHFLKIQEQILNKNKDVLGIVTKPYSHTLQTYVQAKSIGQKQALVIFDQMIKAIYSLYQEGFATRNLRSQHFILCNNKTWKLATMVLDERYEHANGVAIEYLWSPIHQAPECFKKSNYLQDDFYSMLVWNLGSILVQMVLGKHRFTTLQTIEKFKGSPFSFQAIGIKQNISGKFSQQLKETLAYMLHFDPKKRTKLTQLFQNKFLSSGVAKHYQDHKNKVPGSRISSLEKSIVRFSKIDSDAEQSMAQVNKTLQSRQINIRKTLQASKISSVLDNNAFLDELGELGQLGQVSTPIPSKQPNFTKIKPPFQYQSIDDMMHCSDQDIRKALQIYKSYFDQSQLLMQAIDIIERLTFTNMTPNEIQELQMLIKFAIIFVSLINLNTLAEGFNQNRNFLDLDGYIYTAFRSCTEYTAFQRIVNFKRNERAEQFETLRQKINTMKDKPLLSKNPFLSKMLTLGYKRTNFQDIKAPYRFIVKQAYDTIAQQYNDLKKSDLANNLAQTAMYVTYCLTIDKLYIKDHITDNFKYYFEWAKKPACNYVPLNAFKKYLAEAPKEVLIQHSRFILKKYYNI